MTKIGLQTRYRVHLEPREVRALRLLNRGHSISEIAERMGKTRSATMALLGRTYLKFGGGGRDPVLNAARVLGIIPVPAGTRVRRVALPNLSRPTFTRREMQVLRLLNQGLETDEIAQRLGITWGTAHIHESHVRTQLGATRFEALERARALGLVNRPARNVRPMLLSAAQRRDLRRRINELTPILREMFDVVSGAANPTDFTRLGQALGATPSGIAGRLQRIRSHLGVKRTRDIQKVALALGYAK